jgi:hypothetical protein
LHMHFAFPPLRIIPSLVFGIAWRHLAHVGLVLGIAKIVGSLAKLFGPKRESKKDVSIILFPFFFREPNSAPAA